MFMKEFEKIVVEKIPEYLPNEVQNPTIWTEPVKKEGGRELTGLCIKFDGSVVFPRLYLDSFLDEYNTGASLADVLSAIASEYEDTKSLDGIKAMAEDVMKDMYRVRETMSFRLVNSDLNAEMLADRPHRTMCDLALIYSLELGKGMRIPINNNLQKRFDLTEDEMFELAKKNSPKITQAEIVTIGEALGISGMPGDMVVISNTEHADGAVSVLYEGIDEQIRGKIGGDYYLLPYSVHECIAVSKQPNKVEDLRTMVRTINSSMTIRPEDFLSNNVYEIVDGELKIA